MTGPQHYLEAENLLDLGEHEPENSNLTPTLLAAAQVHATLALAGVQSDRLADPYTTCRTAIDAWQDVAGEAMWPVIP